MSRMQKTTILFLASDPSDASRLRLGEEHREIQEKLQLSIRRKDFILEERWSVRPGDITQAVHDVKPQIIHFSGHGTRFGELCLEDLNGKIMPVSPDALASLFQLIEDQVQCVVLNACYSEIQAKAIAAHIDYVVGMSSSIGDRAAIAFAVGFYKALGAGNTIQKAYEFGVVELKLLGTQEHLTPVLYVKSSRKNISLEPDVTKLDFYHFLKEPAIRSIDDDPRFRNLSRGYWVYDEFIATLLENGWVRFAAGFKAGIYAHPAQRWCIKVLGMGVGDNPEYFCERGYYLEHERNLLMDFKEAGCTFQPDVMTQDAMIRFLVEECGVREEQAAARSRHNDVLITEFLPGIPFLTQTGKRLECEMNPCIMNERVLRDIGVALETLGVQLDDANAKGLSHNDPIGFNIVLTYGKTDKVVAKLVDFELAQNSNRQSPEYVNASVAELYKERAVPFNSLSGRYTNNLDQHLIRENLQIVEQLSEKLRRLEAAEAPFRSIAAIGPYSSGIEIKLKNVIEYLRHKN